MSDAATTIDGNLQAVSALWIDMGGVGPAPGGSGHIGGNLQITGTTGSKPGIGNVNALCNTYVAGDVQLQNNSASSPFDIGGAPFPQSAFICNAGPLVIGGNLQVHNNAATIDMGPSGTGSGNTAAGNIEVYDNSGGGTLMNNSAGNDCQLHNDDPPFVVGGNTASRNNDCNNPN